MAHDFLLSVQAVSSREQIPEIQEEAENKDLSQAIPQCGSCSSLARPDRLSPGRLRLIRLALASLHDPPGRVRQTESDSRNSVFLLSYSPQPATQSPLLTTIEHLSILKARVEAF